MGLARSAGGAYFRGTMSFIASHLHRLVLDHDCLVIPGLGGFVSNDRPARFDAAAQELIPPRRAIQFNERLLHNDGVLAHAVAVAEGIPYAEALAAVEREAEGLRGVLQRQRSVQLPHLGRLFIGANGATQFMAEAELERLLDGFGLQRIPLKPLVRKEEEAAVLPISTSVRWPRIAAAIALPLLAGGLWWHSGTLDSAALSFAPGWSGRSVPAAYVPVADAVLPASLVLDSEFDAVLSGVGRVRFDFSTGRIASDGITIGEPAVSTEVKSMEAAAFALVAGAFSKEDNAHRHAHTLVAEGLQPEIHAMGGLHFVVVGLFGAEGDARQALQAVHATGRDAVWMKRL